MSEEIKPCPFVMNHKKHGEQPRLIKKGAWHGYCPQCGLEGRGNRRGGRAYAIEYWNTRTQNGSED